MKVITQLLFRRWKGILFVVTGLAVILAGIFIAFPRHPATYASASGDWSTYMFNVNRTGYNKAETVINKKSAPNLKVHWTASSGGLIFSQPVTAGGVIYWGSFDGYEHATDLSGHEIWKVNLGSRSTCAPLNPLGVVSSAAVVNGVVYVGGGDDNLYALKASDGSVIWKTTIKDPNTTPGTFPFVWDSPLVFNNTVYIGAATTGEATGCKLVPAIFDALDPSTGVILHTFNPEPAGCTGAGIWASPTFDSSSGAVYLATGTEGHCPKGEAIGIVKLKLSTLAYQSSWVIPLADRVHDSDFGATPMLFTATIKGTVHQMVGVPNKNGVFYAFDRTNISGGPLWTKPIANGGICPQCAQGSIASSVFDGSKIYAAGGSTTTINGQNCKGSLRALSPVDGSFLWETCLSGTVMGAITMVPGLLAVVAGAHLTLVDSSTGAILYDVNPSQVTPSHTGSFYGSPSISNGVLYVGSTNGNLYAFGV